MFVTIGSNAAGRATATVLRRNPRGAIAGAEGADEASLRSAIREILPTVMFSVAMKPHGRMKGGRPPRGNNFDALRLARRASPSSSRMPS